MVRFKLRSITVLLLWELLGATSVLYAVTDFYLDHSEKPVNNGKITFVKAREELRPSINLPIESIVETVSISPEKLLKRIKKSAAEKDVEPVSVYLGENPSQRLLNAKALQLAKYGQAKNLVTLFNRVTAAVNRDATQKKQTGNAGRSVNVEVNPSNLALFDLAELAETLKTKHNHLFLDTDELSSLKDQRNALLEQIKGFLTTDQRKKLVSEFDLFEKIDIDRHLLPEFARKMIKKYTIYRGPNCFHAALAFQDSRFPLSSLVNVKVEDGYHTAMVNYDELWRALQKYFYEVDTKTSPLKYGDILVFFETAQAETRSGVDFRWIRHTAAYLFNEFVFSKGSKSPNTPYTVKTIDDEWSNWAKLTKQLGVKVFRRNSSELNHESGQQGLNDWLY